MGHKHTGVSKDRHWQYFMPSTSTEKYITASYQSRQNRQQRQLQDQAEQDTDVHQDDDEHTANDSVTEATSTQPEQSIPVLPLTNDITIPTEKVGCIFVTSHLQQFLEEYPPPSDKQAFLDVYHMLSLLDNICTTTLSNILTACHLIMNM